jgi:hypothetical protein
MVRCQRCGKDAFATIMSYFNTDVICPGCSVEEQKNPFYALARQVESLAVQEGNRNFPGIGWGQKLQGLPSNAGVLWARFWADARRTNISVQKVWNRFLAQLGVK